MKSVLQIIVYLVSAWLIVAGIYRAAQCRLRQKKCTGTVRGRVAEIMEKKSVLTWPNGEQYYPIFEYEAEGAVQMQVSRYPARDRNQLAAGDAFTIRYQPQKPARFFAEKWDEANFSMGIGQMVLGAVLLILTWLFH